MPLKLKVDSIPREPGVSDRLVVVALAGRFVDELLSGLPLVLTPTIRITFGLSYAQISLLSLTLNTVAAIVEPIAGLLIDVWKRPWLMAWGALGIGLGTAVMGLAPTFIILIAGFAIYGLASGPLAQTADVVLVESYPQAPGRIFTRGAFLDTIGALLAPLLVSLALWLGLEWRWLMAGLGASSIIYVFLILRTRFPQDPGRSTETAQGLRLVFGQNLRRVLANREALRWLLFLFIYSLMETPLAFTPIWLREEVGMSQEIIGLYMALDISVGIVSLAYLDRWLARANHRRILMVASLLSLLLFPAWLFVPGIWTRFALAIPLAFFLIVYWPIGKAQSLISAPGRAGTVSALHSLLGVIPLPLLFGLLAEATNLTTAMLLVESAALILMIFLIQRLPAGLAGESEGNQPVAQDHEGKV